VPGPIEGGNSARAAWPWRRQGTALSAVCVAAMGGSHPLAKRVGAWPAVAAVTGVTVAAAGAVICTAGR